MSTRCQIGIYEDENKQNSEFHTLIYKHSDGYEEGVIPMLEPFCKGFIAERGFDIEYIGARLCQWIGNLLDGSVRFEPEISINKAKPVTGCLSLGICKAFHGDIEYFYRINPTEIIIFSCKWDQKPDKFKELKRIPIV